MMVANLEHFPRALGFECLDSVCQQTASTSSIHVADCSRMGTKSTCLSKPNGAAVSDPVRLARCCCYGYLYTCEVFSVHYYVDIRFAVTVSVNRATIIPFAPPLPRSGHFAPHHKSVRPKIEK